MISIAELEFILKGFLNFSSKYLLGSKTVTTKLTFKTSEKENENFLRQILFQNRFFLTKVFAEETRDIRQELEKGRYTMTERVFPRSLRSDRALPKHRYDISPCILVYPLMLSSEDRSEPISCFPPF